MKKLILLLKRERGASIVLALYFMLICTTLSSLMILSGSVAAGKSINQEENARGENIALSFFRLVSDELSSKTIKYNPNESISFFEQDLRRNGFDLMNSYVAEGFEKLQEEDEHEIEYEKDFEVKINNADLKIAGTFALNRGYEIEITINQISDNSGNKYTSNIKSIKFYPLKVEKGDKEIIVKIGDANIT